MDEFVRIDRASSPPGIMERAHHAAAVGSRAMVVNTIVALEIFYLFNVRYPHMASFTWRGALGTPPLLIAIAVVVARFTFIHLPVMQHLFATRPVSPADGVLIVAMGIIAMAILEGEGHPMRRFGGLSGRSLVERKTRRKAI